MFKGKKGLMEEYEIGRKAIYIIVILIVVTATAFTLYAIIGQFRNVLVQTPGELHTSIYLQRFLGCLAYQDPNTGRPYPGIIDNSKFTEDILNKCYQSSEHSLQELRLELYVNGQVKDAIETKNFGIPKSTLPLYVLLFENGKTQPAKLLVKVQPK